LSRRKGSSGGDPIVNRPGGKTTISGQWRHSLKVCPGSRAGRSLCPCADAHASATTTVAIGSRTRRAFMAILEPVSA